MKPIAQYFKEAKERITLPEGTMNFISSADLSKYLTIADKFISPEAKNVVNWLIDNNAEYINKLGGKDKANALESFYNNGIPAEDDLKELYKWVGTLVKEGRQLEIPVFQTKEQFYGILNKEVSPDEILLDLRSSRGRNDVVKKYNRLVWKIVQSFQGKSTLTSDELYSAGLTGLTYAMNNYGKQSIKKETTNDQVKGYTFMSYAAYCIRNMILDDIRNNSRIVRVAVSAQNKEKKETGSIKKNNTLSGDQIVKGSDNKSKTLFDFMGSEAGLDSAEYHMNAEDAEKIWQEVFTELEKKFNSTTLDIWYSFYQMNGKPKKTNKELGQMYNMSPSQITYYLYIVNSYILKNKKIRGLMNELREIMSEARRLEDESSSVFETEFTVKKDRDASIDDDIF